jgi:hypothetical protein
MIFVQYVTSMSDPHLTTNAEIVKFVARILPFCKYVLLQSRSNPVFSMYILSPDNPKQKVKRYSYTTSPR